MKQLYIGLFTEGNTDNRFLESIVTRTYDKISYECTDLTEINVIVIKIEESGLSFIESVEKAARKGVDDFGVMILCVHTDADSRDDGEMLRQKILPALEHLDKIEEEICKNIVAVIPVQMSEAWMLADIDLLKREIGTNKSDEELNLKKYPEEYSDPKRVIEEAIRIARSDMPQRRRQELKISHLYQPLGLKMPISKLENLDSFIKFKNNVYKSLKKLNYII